MADYSRRKWSVRNARWLKSAYAAFETLLVWVNPLLRLIGHQRLDKSFAAIEKATKGKLLDSPGCGQCIVGSTGLSCPMNCPKEIRNGPCGGVRPDGNCEVDPNMPCVWVLAWEGNKRFAEDGFPIQRVQPPLDNRLFGKSAWLREVRIRTQPIGDAAREV